VELAGELSFEVSSEAAFVVSSDMKFGEHVVELLVVFVVEIIAEIEVVRHCGDDQTERQLLQTVTDRRSYTVKIIKTNTREMITKLVHQVVV
jgi:hypothetical protein